MITNVHVPTMSHMTLSVLELPEPDDRTDAVQELLGGDGTEPSVRVSGGRTAFTQGLQIVKEGGRYMVTGQMDSPGKEVLVRPGYITHQQSMIVGTWSGDSAEYRKALDFMALTADRYDFGAMMPNRYGLDDTTKALTRMRAQEDIKPVIVPHGT